MLVNWRNGSTIFPAGYSKPQSKTALFCMKTAYARTRMTRKLCAVRDSQRNSRELILVIELSGVQFGLKSYA